MQNIFLQNNKKKIKREYVKMIQLSDFFFNENFEELTNINTKIYKNPKIKIFWSNIA